VKRILVDADACPVKPEIFRVAKRHGLRVFLVSNSWMRVPREEWLELVVVNDAFDAADNWITEQSSANEIVVTGDILLASRCLKAGAAVLDFKGRLFTEDSIGGALANRELMSHLREIGAVTGGPAPIEDRDRSRFLHALDELVRRGSLKPS
jgi:uncharacterized protein YaiI (UPF0178 family)